MIAQDRHKDGDEDSSEGTRRCLVSGHRAPRQELIRLVVGPDDVVVPDVDEKLPGRGLWLSAARSVVHTACAKRLFARAARRTVVVPDDLADRIEALLVQRCVDVLSLARRAGQAVSGFEKVRAAVTSPQAAVLVAATDGAADGIGKLRHLAPQVPRLEALRADEIGRAFGRDKTVHAVVMRGGLAQRLRVQGQRLAGFRE